MLSFFQRLVHRSDSEKGASAVEYGLLVAAIAAIIVVIVFALGKLVQGSFKSTCDNIANKDADAATTPTASCVQ